MPSQPSVLVLGIGNEYRGDDGTGRVVARKLLDAELPSVTVREASGEGATLMEAWTGVQSVIIVDAVESGAPPGRVHRFDAQVHSMPSRFFHYSTHAFSLAEAIELARALQKLPPRLIVFGIEGKSFAAGVGLSPEVSGVVKEVVARVCAEIRQLTKAPPN